MELLVLSPVAGDTEKTVRLCVSGTFSALACFTDIAQLSCPDNRTINATSGVYGQYIDPHGFACPNDCCPPNPLYDCTELVYNNAPEDWVTIKLLCDGETHDVTKNCSTVVHVLQVHYHFLSNDIILSVREHLTHQPRISHEFHTLHQYGRLYGT